MVQVRFGKFIYTALKAVYIALFNFTLWSSYGGSGRHLVTPLVVQMVLFTHHDF